MVLQIKQASIDDINIVAPLFNAYRIFYNQASDMAGATNFLYERIVKNQSTLFIAFINVEAVGFTQLYSIFSSVSLRPALLLNDLYIAERASKLGIASALLNKAKEFGKQNNAGWLLLETAFDNYNTQSLYEKNGWIKQNDFFFQFSLQG